MVQRSLQLLLLLFVVGCFSTIASADDIPVGLLSYDAISASQDQFDITNLTGADAFPPIAPITTALTFTVSSLVVDFTSGPALTLPGSDFTSDAAGDEDCTNAACNLSGDSVTSATLTGTLSPTTGLAGLPAGDTGIESAFTATLAPGLCGETTLVAGCDLTIINASGTTGVAPPPPPTGTPEPGTLALVGIGSIGLLLFGSRRSRGAGSIVTA